MANTKQKSKAKRKPTWTVSKEPTMKKKNKPLYKRYRDASKGKRPPVASAALVLPARTKMGRPSILENEELICTILERMAAGENLLSICSDEGMPEARTVIGCTLRNPEFKKRYDEAVEIRSHVWGEQLKQISDTPNVMEKITRTTGGKNGDTETVFTSDALEHRKLQIGTVQWIIARQNSKSYGDKVQTENKTDHNINIKVIKRIFVEPNGKIIEHD